MLLNIDEEALAKKIQDLIFNEIAGCLPKRAEIRLNLQPVIAEAVISSREYFHDITKEAIQEALQDLLSRTKQRLKRCFRASSWESWPEP